MNAFCIVNKLSTRRRKYRYSFNSQICSSRQICRTTYRTSQIWISIDFITYNRAFGQEQPFLQEASAVILFDSDSDNSIVYEYISLLLYNVITLVAGAAIISRQIRTSTLLYVMICQLHGICRYERISCYSISCTVMFEKCNNLVCMNGYGT